MARVLMLATLALPLGACDAIVLNPAGDVARQQANLVIASTLLMLLIIIPVMLLTVFFAWKYRASNQEARYEPDWDHSTQLELVIWAAPLLIIICLGALTWVTTHLLDPYRPITQLEKGRPVSAEVAPLEVNVVALDWKWLFIYPEQGIATVNELVVPKDRPINFRITSSSVMNSFYVPALAGQVYAMPGMETKLHGVLNRTGEFTGFSANYSGAGFSSMRFAFRGVTDADFGQWVKQVKAGKDGSLDRSVYQELVKPSEKEAVRHYASVDGALFNAIVDMCVQPGKMCMSQIMAIDAQGGLGLAGVYNVAMLNHDKYGTGDSFRPSDNDRSVDAAYVRALCADLKPGQVLPASVYAPRSLAPLVGAGLRNPLDKGTPAISQSAPPLSPVS
ncbi:MAG: ubiquinol oxidase subunit II [Sphingobium sp.]|nr:ubiquinol oxidase subunit II [Sphingobium sp.]